jgi:hypothetical protein
MRDSNVDSFVNQRRDDKNPTRNPSQLEMPETNTFGVENKGLYKKVHITPLRGAYFELQPLQFKEDAELRSKSATPRYTEDRKVRGNIKEILFKPVAPTP